MKKGRTTRVRRQTKAATSETSKAENLAEKHVNDSGQKEKRIKIDDHGTKGNKEKITKVTKDAGNNPRKKKKKPIKAESRIRNFEKDDDKNNTKEKVVVDLERKLNSRKNKKSPGFQPYTKVAKKENQPGAIIKDSPVPDIEKIEHESVAVEPSQARKQKSSDKITCKGKSPVKGSSTKKSSHIPEKSVRDSEESGGDGDDSEMEWEDVAEAQVGTLGQGEASSSRDSNSPSTSSNVEVTIKVPGKKKSGRPSQEEIRQWIQRKINRIRKESQICVHKVHLLALVARGLQKNELCNNPILLGIGLSIVPDQLTQRVPKKWDVPFLTRVAIWFKNKAPTPGEIHTSHSEGTYLMRVLEKKIYFFVVILRALGLAVRLVMSLQAVGIKVNNTNGTKNVKTPRKPKNTTSEQTKGKVSKQKATVKKESTKSPKENLLNKMKGKSTPTPKGVGSSRKPLRKKPRVDYSMDHEKTENEYFKGATKTFSGDSSSAVLSNYSDDELDFEMSSETRKRRRISSRDQANGKLEGEGSSHGLDETSNIPKRGVDMWVEVYLEKEGKWICIDGEAYSVNQPEECEKHATKPVKYILAFDNEGCIKDVTSVYASGWLTSTPKLRVDPEWWTETLCHYKTKNRKRDKKEDALIKARLLRKPLPTTVSDFKNHPLYALKRHLLKFEAIYPDTAATLGFCRGEPVYSRDCVHTLHTREIWMKEARVVKSGETPYKIVKGRKSKRKMLENVGEITAELFGRWQTEDYVPPPVIDGKIPRNEYGNVELFKPSMLPLGTCHIQVPGIHRLARKLNIDAVPAVVGFDFHCGFSHPVIDGVVVCEEYKDVLLSAWEKEEEQKIKREQEKREKRVLDRWAYLVRSLRIRERLKRKYNMEAEHDVKAEAEKKPDAGEGVTDISLSWPLNKQEGKFSKADDGHCHVFLETNHSQDPVTGEWYKTCSCGHKEPL